jgi:tRNA A-37 threonylcarbamoyl transferase component Bud32
MSDSTSRSTLDAAQSLWQLWEAGQRPDANVFLATAGPLSTPQLAAVLRVDQRGRWQIGEGVRAESYLREFPNLQADADDAIDLIYNEFILRERYGQRPGLEEYLQRFPEYADALCAQIELHQVIAATSGVGHEEWSPNDDDTSRSLVNSGAALHAPLSIHVPGYEILEELGRGGMGVVYKARHARLQRLVALKMLLAGRHAGPEHLARLRTEALAVARLQHPNILQIYEVGEAEGCPFLALEFIEGGSLKDRLCGRTQSAQDSARFVETLARAIHYAHLHDVIHRDLKPGNILLVSGGVVSGESSCTTPHLSLSTYEPKIADFGLAKQLEGEATASGDATESGTVLGTPCYMAPEQATGRPGNTGPGLDIYALGAILYELVTGRPPFRSV